GDGSVHGLSSMSVMMVDFGRWFPGMRVGIVLAWCGLRSFRNALVRRGRISCKPLAHPFDVYGNPVRGGLSSSLHRLARQRLTWRERGEHFYGTSASGDPG